MLGRSGSVLLPAGGVKGRRVKGRDPVTSVSVVAASLATVLPSSAFNSGSGITVVSGSTRVIGLTGSDLGGGGGGTAARRGGSAGRVRGDVGDWLTWGAAAGTACGISAPTGVRLRLMIGSLARYTPS